MLLQFRAKEFGNGVIDSCRLWEAFQSSRTLRSVALKQLPLHATTIILGCWFHAVDWYISSSNFDHHRYILWITWTVLWGAPMYVLGGLLQLRHAWKLRSTVTTHTTTTNDDDGVTKTIAEGVYGALLNLTFLFQVWLVNTLVGALLPRMLSDFVQPAYTLVNVAWATAFAAFESRLIIKNQKLFQRVHFLETHWSYALGYGMIAAIIYLHVWSAIANGVWQYAVLLLMLNAMRLRLLEMPTAAALHGDDKLPRNSLADQFRYRLRIFWLAQLLALFVIQHMPMMRVDNNED